MTKINGEFLRYLRYELSIILWKLENQNVIKGTRPPASSVQVRRAGVLPIRV
ncbi:MAG: hypothetical protein KJ666_09360 [Bacteroidetes bacterium]|nr:hypothetical protein [Bacteroidota bacterium]